jgi:hypothetical protein
LILNLKKWGLPVADFAFYSIDIEPTVDPQSADPAPATLVVFDQPPIFGEYEEPGGNRVRGSVHPTLGGVQVQDFGTYVTDGRIRIAESDALEADTVAAIQTLNESAGTQYYFTDGFSVWKVQFSRPNGFLAFKNIFWAQHAKLIYSYEINLVVMAKEV